MGCPECGCEEIIKEDDTLVCYECGTPIRTNDVREDMDSTEEEDNDSDELVIDDDDFEDQPTSKKMQHTAEDEDASGVVKSKNNMNTKASGKAEQASIPEKMETAKPRPEKSVPTCKSCGGTHLILDSINETEHLICGDCGAFSEQQKLVVSQEYTQNSGTSRYQAWSGTRRPRFMMTESPINRGMINGTKTIQSMSSQMSWQTYLTDQAVCLYEKLYPHERVKHTSNQFKDALCIACLYSVARENEMNITLKTLMGLKKVKTKFVTKALKLLKVIRNKPLAHQTVSSLPEHVLAVGDFNKKFVDKVSRLVQICEKGFVTQGRDHSHVATALAHLVWLSEDYRGRKSVSLSRFCSEHNLKYGRHCFILQKHIKKLFVKLARQLPWVCKTIKESNCLHYLDNIATHGLSLVSRACQMDSGTKRKSAGSSHSQCSSDDEKTASSGLPHLAPPCMKPARNDVRAQSPPRLPDHISAADLDKEDLGDTEFSDQEINSYILTPEEAMCKRTVTVQS